MRYLVYLDDNPQSYAAFYKAMELVEHDDWIILLANVEYGKGKGHEVHHAMKHFGRLMDRRKIKSLEFMEPGSMCNVLRDKCKQLQIDVVIINPHDSKMRKLCNYVKDNAKKAKLMVVNHFEPHDKSLVPNHGIVAHLPKKRIQVSESMSSIHTPSYPATRGLPEIQEQSPMKRHLLKSQSEAVMSPRAFYLKQQQQLHRDSIPTTSTSTPSSSNTSPRAMSRLQGRHNLSKSSDAKEHFNQYNSPDLLST